MPILGENIFNSIQFSEHATPYSFVNSQFSEKITLAFRWTFIGIWKAFIGQT
jgi:hypothetical protein